MKESENSKVYVSVYNQVSGEISRLEQLASKGGCSVAKFLAKLMDVALELPLQTKKVEKEIVLDPVRNLYAYMNEVTHERLGLLILADRIVAKILAIYEKQKKHFTSAERIAVQRIDALFEAYRTEMLTIPVITKIFA